MSDVLNVGISGLLVSQRALSVVSHNVSNVNTDGYSRQRTDIISRLATYSGAGYMGNGAATINTRRMYSEFLNGQVITNTSASEYYKSFADYASQMDNLLADPNAGLSPALDAFFKANHGVANDPTSVPARQVLITAGESLENRFSVIYKRMQDLRDNVNLEMRNIVEEVNSLAKEIANINQAIASSPGLSVGRYPNDLMDAREQMLKQLSQHVNVQTVQQDNFALNVYIGNGQALVSNFESQTMSIVANEYDTSELEIAYNIGNTAVNITNLLSGGKLGALLQQRDTVITPIQNALGRIATGLTEQYNIQHRLGLDLDSQLGGDFFSVAAPDVLPSTNNTGGATITATINDSNLLTDSDYMLSYDGANYMLRRMSDNVIEATFAPGAMPYTSTDGFIIDDGGVPPAAGDSFMIRPTRAASRTFSTLITDTSRVAAAAPVRVEADLNNIGTGNMELKSVTDTGIASAFAVPGALTPPLRIEFDPANPNQYQIVDAGTLVPIVGAGYALAYNPATGVDVLAANGLGAYGYEITITGEPGLGDVFTTSYNQDGLSDNFNALQLEKLQSTRNMLNGTASFMEAYGSMISDVGTRSNQANISNKAQATLLDQAVAAREAVSGVNLDEEAADMLRFEQSYQAAAQVISAAQKMFDELINAARS